MADLEALWTRWHAGDQSRAVFDQLVAGHDDLVRAVARSARAPKHVDVADLEQVGRMGLMKAIRTWDPERGEFEVWATYRIRDAVRSELRSADRAVGRAARTSIRRLHAAEERLTARLHRAPTDRVLCAAIDVTEDEVRELRMLELMATSVDVEADVAHHEDPAEIVVVNSQREDLSRALEALDGREAVVLRLYYLRRLTFEQIGEVIGLGAPMVSRLHTRGVQRLLADLRG